MGKLNNKVALVTGGNSGIGYATAKKFIEEGAQKVIVIGRNEVALKKAVEKLGSKAEYIVCDSRNMKHIYALHDKIKSVTNRLDVVFLNAGLSDFLPIENITEEHFDALFDTNVKGVVFTLQQVLPLISVGSSIVLTSTAGVKKGFPGASIYVASKTALNGLVIIWAKELNDRKIRINSISPGFVDTPLFDKIGLNKEQKEDAINLYSGSTVIKRFATAEEIASAVVFLSSDDSIYMTGSDLLIDGGYAIQ